MPDVSSESASVSAPTKNPMDQNNSGLENRNYKLVFFYAPILGLAVSPILILLPPRKLDFYTFGLGGVFYMSAQQLYSGRGREYWDPKWRPTRTYTPSGQILESEPSSSYRTTENDLYKMGDIQSSANRAKKSIVEEVSSLPGFDQQRMEEAQAQQRQENEREEQIQNPGGVRGMFQKIWYGDEKPGWEQRRMEEERRRLEAGDTIWDIMTDQISEVFNGKKSGDDGKEE